MEAQGLVTWLVWLLTIRAVIHAAAAYQSLPGKQVTAADAAKAFALEWRMEATAHIASLMVRDQQCKGDPTNCDLQEGASDAIETLSKWAVGDQGWERLLSSVSLYAIARHAYQEAEYDEAIIALEESLALRLFAYADQKTLDRWQQGLVMPGSLFRRQKMDLANTLVLRSDCLVQLAREQRDVDDLTEAMELLQLATALLKGGEELIPDSVAAISRRAATIASVAAELLPQLKISRIREVLDHHGMSCAGCSSKADYLQRLVPLLRLPVQVVTGATSGSSKSVGSSSSHQQHQAVIEPLKDPFVSHATVLLKKSQEHVAQYMQRVFFRLLTLVPADYLAELQVACRRQDAKGRCISYLPHWVTAQAITIDKRTGMAHVSRPGGYAHDADASSSISLPDQTEAGDSSSNGNAGSCASGSGSTAAAAGAQLGTEAFFVPGDAAGSKAGGLPAPEPHNRAGVDLCGFLHIRAIPPGVNLPTTGGSLTPQQQKALKDKAAEGLASGTAVNSPFKGVYYYFYTDIPALIDRIINTFDPEEADFLFEQLDGLTAARSLGLAGRLNTPPQRHCNEQTLLEGKAPPTCSVLVPNIGSCARAPLKPPRRRIPMDPIPTDLGLPPTVGTYKPRYRAKMATAAGYAGHSLGDSSNDSDGQGSSIGGGGGLGSSGSKGRASGKRGRHRNHHHHNFPVTDRELSDRQLQEQMVKLARDAGRRDRDDPLVPLTLAGCAVASFGLYLASKRRRRSGVNSSSGCSSAAARLVLLGLGPGRVRSGTSGDLMTANSGGFASSTGLATAGSGVAAATAAAGPGTLGDGDEFDGGGSTKQKRQIVAALRVAMNNSSDASRLEAALAEAEAADLGEAGLLQRARALLDKRRKKDQAKAAAEKAKLKAQRKEEARKGRKAAAKQAAAATAGAQDGVSSSRVPLQRSSTSSKASDCTSQVDAGDLESDADSRRSNFQDFAHAEPAPRGGTFMRFLQLFGLGPSSSGVTTAFPESDRPKEEFSRASRSSSSCLSRASSISALAAAATDAVALQQAATGQLSAQDTSKDFSCSQGRHIRSEGNSNNSSSNKSDMTPAAGSTAARACSSHPLQIGPTGSSIDELMSSMLDDPTSPSSPGTAAACITASATPVNTKQHSATGGCSTSSKRNKGRDKGGNQQGSKVTGFQEVEEVPGWTRAPKEGAAVRSSVVKAVLDPFTAAAAKAASHPLLSTPSKNKHKAKQQAAVTAAAGGVSGSAGVSPAKRADSQQQRSAAAQGNGFTAGVTAPVTPPAVATGAAAGDAIRGNSGGKHTGSGLQFSAQQQQQQGPAPAGWTRRSAVSDDGSFSRPSTAGSFQQQQGSLTPGKPKLNPKATPYHPSSAMPAGGKPAAGSPAAAMYGGYVSAGHDWQQQHHGTAAGPGAYFLPMRGASPVGFHGGLMMSREGYQQQQQMSPMVNGGHSIGTYQQHSSMLGHQNAVDAALEIVPPGNGLMSYSSADYPSCYQGDQGLTSPNHHHHHANVMLPELAGLVSPQHHQVNGRLVAAMQQHQQHMHQQQLLELLSAAGTAEAAALGVRLASAGGSAPLNHGSGMDSVATAAGNMQRSSYSSLPEVNAVQAGAGLGSRGSGMAPPGFTGHYNAARASTGLYGQGSSDSSGVSNRKGPGVLPLSLDDDQLPPGFSAEDYSTPTSQIGGGGYGTGPEPPSSHGLASAAVASPGNIPTTAPLGVFAADSSVWAPLAATAGNAASTVAAGVRSLWPATLATTAALPTDYSTIQHSYSRSQDLEVEVAAAATSANVAELVLGSSPVVSSGRVSGSVAADPQMSKLAKEIMAIVAE